MELLRAKLLPTFHFLPIRLPLGKAAAFLVASLLPSSSRRRSLLSSQLATDVVPSDDDPAPFDKFVSSLVS